MGPKRANGRNGLNGKGRRHGRMAKSAPPRRVSLFKLGVAMLLAVCALRLGGLGMEDAWHRGSRRTRFLLFTLTPRRGAAGVSVSK